MARSLILLLCVLSVVRATVVVEYPFQFDYAAKVVRGISASDAVVTADYSYFPYASMSSSSFDGELSMSYFSPNTGIINFEITLAAHFTVQDVTIEYELGGFTTANNIDAALTYTPAGGSALTSTVSLPVFTSAPETSSASVTLAPGSTLKLEVIPRDGDTVVLKRLALSGCVVAGDCAGTCGSLTSCSMCADGYYGAVCDTYCPANASCTADSAYVCDQQTGRTTSCTLIPTTPCVPPAHCQSPSCDASGTVLSCAACDDGWSGATCDTACPTASTCTSVVTCSQSGTPIQCASCSGGYYGNACDQACPANASCVSGQPMTCDQTTGQTLSCTLVPPPPPPPPGAAPCTPPVNCVAATCDATGVVQSCQGCAAGMYGAMCTQSCTNAQCTGTVTCDQATGASTACQGCAQGFWGTTCASACAANASCVDNTITCKKNNGAWISCTAKPPVCSAPANCQTASGCNCTSCKAGYYGDDCSITCPPSSNCVGPTCDMTTGALQSCSSCSGGYTGTTCQTVPSTGCAAGKWGVLCDQDCVASSSCATTSATCNRSTGAMTQCTAGCRAGLWGAVCDKVCAAVTNCRGTAPTCQQSTGVAVSCPSCADGYYGATCQSTCPVAAKCLGTRKCSQADGTLLSCGSCVAGSMGPTCTTSCPAPSANCAGLVSCAQDGTAAVCSGCKPGFYGGQCQLTCLTGTCASSSSVTCNANGSPVSCTACAKGYYSGDLGPTCLNHCDVPERCTGAVTCDVAVGTPIKCDACAAGWSGDLCTVSQQCPDPGQFDHGTRFFSNGLLYGSAVAYSCNAGYHLDGATLLVCRSNGTWSGTPPVCVAEAGASSTTSTTAAGSDSTTSGDATTGGDGATTGETERADSRARAPNSLYVNTSTVLRTEWAVLVTFLVCLFTYIAGRDN